MYIHRGRHRRKQSKTGKMFKTGKSGYKAMRIQCIILATFCNLKLFQNKI